MADELFSDPRSTSEIAPGDFARSYSSTVNGDKMTKPAVVSLPLVFLVFACAPDNDVEPPADEGPVQSDDEASGLPPLDPDTLPVPAGNNVCLTNPEPPYQGVWHQCGGSFDITLTGDVLGNTIDESISIDFGPGVEGDAYEAPRVAACCGEFDFERPFSDQREYAENCLYDSIQQFCAALPYYIWDMAKVAGDNDNPLGESQLNQFGNQLATAEKQFECIEDLWAGGPTDPYYYAITAHSWNAIGNVWVNIVVAEINDLYLPEDPADWITCSSIFENDDTVLPDSGPGGPLLDSLLLDAGSLKVTGLELAATLTPAPSSELVVSMETLGHLQLQGGATRLGAAAVDRWRLSTLRAVPMVARADGARTVAVGSLTFVGAAVVGGDTITTMAHNTTEVVLWPKGGSWHIEPFTVVYTAATGDAWTLQTSDLDFLAR